MAEIREQLIAAKRKLVTELGKNEKIYWSIMKAWFKQRLSKEEFDTEARRLLPKQKTHLHNEFLLAVLTKCHLPNLAGTGNSRESSSAQSSSKVKKSKRLQAIKRKYDHRFMVNQAHINPPPTRLHVQDKAVEQQSPQPIKMCYKSLMIPSVEEMKNYISVITWEMGLDDATDDVMAYATEAVRVFLKNLLSAIFSRRSAYKTVNKTFKYAMGCEPENPYLNRKQSLFSTRLLGNSDAHLSCTSKEQIQVEEIGRVAQTSFEGKAPLNMYDLLHTFKIFGSSLIPSHTVYSLATERVLANLWHPDHDELKQDEIMKVLKHSISSDRIAQ